MKATARIPLQDGSGAIVGWTSVDDCLSEWLATWKWHLSERGYAARAANDTTLQMHRQLLGLVPGDRMQGDHINGEKLDNRLGNLRVVSAYVNSLNKKRTSGKSGAVGVTFDPKRRNLPWRARFGRQSLGWYATVEQAADVARRAREAKIEELIAA